ncbi:MAG: hypothetical protein QOH77_1481 [Actinomycetota bacterium]|nr:hypothetical protein [Actinomycetota bacterium]
MSRRAILPESLRGTPFSVQEALELGIPPGRLRAKDLTRPFRAARVGSGDPGEKGGRASSRSQSAALDETLELCRAYVPIMREDQLFSHLTAARLYGFPLPSRRQHGDQLDVWAEAVQVKTAGIVGHRSSPVRSWRHLDLAVVEPVVALVQLASVLQRDDLILIGDYLLRQKRPLCTPDELIQAVGRAKGVRGIRRLRLALEDIRPGTDSPMETITRILLTRGGLPEPTIHHTIFDDAGSFIGTPDLAYVNEKIAIEYEGEDHRTDRAVFAEDIERRELMQEAGWYVIRVISDHVYRYPVWLVERVRRKLVERRPV